MLVNYFLPGIVGRVYSLPTISVYSYYDAIKHKIVITQSGKTTPLSLVVNPTSDNPADAININANDDPSQILRFRFSQYDGYHVGVGLLLDSEENPADPGQKAWLDVKGDIYRNGKLLDPDKRYTNSVKDYCPGATYGNIMSFRGNNFGQSANTDYYVFSGYAEGSFNVVRLAAGTNDNKGLWSWTLPCGKYYYGSSFPAGAHTGDIFFKKK